MKKIMKLASCGKRLGAYLIDAIVPIIFIIVISVSTAGIARSFSNNSYFYNYGYGYGYGYNSSPFGSIAAVIVGIIMFLAYIAVQIYFYSKSQTIGKAILGLQVVDCVTGNPIGVWKMLLREWFAKKASKVVLCLGFIWILIDDKKRCWHDKIVDTYVVDIKESEALVYDDRSTAEQTEDVVTDIPYTNEINADEITE